MPSIKRKSQQLVRLARINNPTPILLLFLPCLFGVFLSLKQIDNPNFNEIWQLILLFLGGAIIMRSAGCIINDMWDQKFDAKVSRTKNRPLANKSVSNFEALISVVILLSLALLILLQFNLQVILSGLIAVILVITYPLMKRITYYPQVFLGITFNFGIIIATLQILQKITLESIILYIACIIWTVIYDTIYAFQDLEDDLKIGLKSTAVKFHNNANKILSRLSFSVFTLLLFLGWKSNFETNYFLTILLLELFLSYKIRQCNFKNAKSCRRVFRANIAAGVLILTAIILG